MDLVKVFGSYENARERGKRENVLDDYDFNYAQKSLLKYRREHKIYEEGDFVTFDATFCDSSDKTGFGKITDISNDRKVYEIDNCYLVSLGEFRHASDEEVEARADYEIPSKR